ncbi:MAG: glycosyltransferase family 39 protein [Chlorobiales bacterium]|nr:glycosyltransferase family 39 protein [Chlorobiales bacterium]
MDSFGQGGRITGSSTVLIALGVIVITGFSLRVWGIDFGLPYMYHPDEPNKIIIAQRMFKTGDLDPHYFKKPTFFIYLNALLYIPYYFYGKVTGIFSSPADIQPPLMLAMGTGYTSMPETILMARMLTVVVATATIPLLYVIGKQVSGKTSVGLIAAVAIALFPASIMHSRFVTVNSFLVFFIAMTVLVSLRILRHGKRGDYILAGVMVGLAISSKYPGALAGIIPVAAHFLRTEKLSLKGRELYMIVFAILLAFFLTTPFALLNSSRFLEDTLYESRHYSTGHAGMEGNAFKWYLGYIWKMGGIIPVLALLEVGRGLVRRSKPIILLSVFPVLYFIFISSFEVRNDRTFLPITPFLFLLASSFLVYLLNYVRGLRPKVARWGTLLVAGLCVIVIVYPFMETIRNAKEIKMVDSRKTASKWINNNLPPGAQIAIESYSPFVDPERFSIMGTKRIINRDPKWYVFHGFDYLVFSEGMYQRFYREPGKYRNEVAAYDYFFDLFTEVKYFDDGGYEVKVYRIDSSNK